MEMSEEVRQRLAKADSEGLCVACMEPLDKIGRVIRGCHERCSAAMWRAINAGTWTEQQRIDEGKLLPAAPGRPATNPVTIEAQRAKD